MKRLRVCLRTMTLCATGILATTVLPSAAPAATCARWVAKVVSAQGMVQVQRAGEAQRLPVKLNDTFCPGDMIRVQEKGRADLLLSNDTLLRLDQNTTIRFYVPEKERNYLLDLLAGAAYFITRTPKRFKCTTPFVNAGVEGTEFLLVVGTGQTFLSNFEGKVIAENNFGGILLAAGQSAVAEEGKPPVLRVVARPRDAVQWTLYYPPILPPGPAELFPGVPGEWQTRVSRLLSVGRVDEAKAEIEEVLKKTPGDSTALSLQSVIAVARNEKEKALSLARQATGADPRSASAKIALSYAQQAGFDLADARQNVEDAVRLEPGNALAWARLSELWMSSGNLDEALTAANKAAGLSPDLARTQSVLGFAYLAQIKTKASKEAFGKAIVLDQADPLPRLGLGLAKIREGDLTEGRREIEIAASLDPNNSLIRSYLGKAYYEEKRDKPASGQMEMAKELDPSDPTPWFYDAIRKQTVNRPVEALHDLQKSISLNDNRAVYRSRLLLDEDLAARSASLGRIYNDLGFQQSALAEGWNSVNTDPANYSAHRFLADSYSALPRHEIARVSELLQSQLLQPINISPVQPRLVQTSLSTLNVAGPGDLSFNEFSTLFNRNRLALQANALGGSERTFGEEIVLSGVWGPLSYSLGQFHFETHGSRPNDDQRKTLYDLFVQESLSHKTSVQAEFRYAKSDSGDLGLLFFADDFSPNLRNTAQVRDLRLGFRHAFSPRSDLIASLIYESRSSDQTDTGPDFSIIDNRELKSYSYELQHLLRLERISLVAGVGHVKVDEGIFGEFSFVFDPDLPPEVIPSVGSRNTRHTNVYLYSLVHFPKHVTWTVGASADFVNNPNGTSPDERNTVNPKLGVTWNPLPGTTLRAAAFRVFRKTLPLTGQTLEPTQVAGFAQFFDDTQGAEAWRYGLGWDQKLSESLYGGLEYSKRDLQRIQVLDFVSGNTELQDGGERLVRAYVYWTPVDPIALSAEYQRERFDHGQLYNFNADRIITHRVPLGINYFHPCGLILRGKATFIDQEGVYKRLTDFALPPEEGSDHFWITDASIGYRLPKRYGLVTLEGKNLFNSSFRFQDTDPANAVILPKRTFFLKIALAI